VNFKKNLKTGGHLKPLPPGGFFTIISKKGMEFTILGAIAYGFIFIHLDKNLT
jgi:hypothetical protein